jgi:hypothetical protein
MIAELLNKITQLRADYTTAKAAFLDVSIASRAAAATALTDATWTDTRAGLIDNLDAAISTIGNAPPITSGLKGRLTLESGRQSGIALDTGVGSDGIEAATQAAATYNAWVSLKAETGAGIISILNVYQEANASNLNADFRLSIDGNIVITSASNFWNATGDDDAGCNLIGWIGGDVPRFEAIPFTTSFDLEIRKSENTAGTFTGGCNFRYFLTG